MSKLWFDLTQTYRKGIEEKLKQEFNKKQEELIKKFHEQLENSNIKNLELETKLNSKDNLLRKKLKLELESEFSAKELAMETKRMDLENKLKNLENNKDKEIKLALMRGIQQKRKELSMNFELQKTEKNEEILRFYKN